MDQDHDLGRRQEGANLLQLAWVPIWTILAAIGWIIASNFDIVLRSVWAVVDEPGCICQNRLDLGLLVIVEPWSTQILQRCCIIPINIGSDPWCVRHNPCIVISTVDFVLGFRAKVFLAAVITPEECRNAEILGPLAAAFDLVRSVIAREVGGLYRGTRSVRGSSTSQH